MTRYADQRGHDVTWMTAAERAEVDQRMVRLERALNWRGTCGRCGKTDATAEHVAWCDWQPA